jgi:hypothetical protein
MEEWRALDKKFTSHYLNMIEKEMERAHSYAYQVVEVEKQGETVTHVIVAVFVRRDGDRDDCAFSTGKATTTLLHSALAQRLLGSAASEGEERTCRQPRQASKAPKCSGARSS